MNKYRPFTLSALLPAAIMLFLWVMEQGARAAGTPAPEISFSVFKMNEENVEGPDVERTYFLAGGKRIVFGQPKGCSLTADGNRLVILPSEAGLDGEIHVERSLLTVESDLAEDALKYRAAAVAGMPAGATGVEVQPPVMNPFPYNGWKSLGFTWTYVSAGRPMVRTVSFINLEIGTQIVVTTLATKKDADEVNKIARKFMSSWWVLGR